MPSLGVTLWRLTTSHFVRLQTDAKCPGSYMEGLKARKKSTASPGLTRCSRIGLGAGHVKIAKDPLGVFASRARRHARRHARTSDSIQSILVASAESRRAHAEVLCTCCGPNRAGAWVLCTFEACVTPCRISCKRGKGTMSCILASWMGWHRASVQRFATRGVPTCAPFCRGRSTGKVESSRRSTQSR